jgi:hypothetical protein
LRLNEFINYLLWIEIQHAGVNIISPVKPGLSDIPEPVRDKPLNAPAAFIHPCQPIVAKQPPTGTGSAHELKHDAIGCISTSAIDGCAFTRSMVPTGRNATR